MAHADFTSSIKDFKEVILSRGVVLLQYILFIKISLNSFSKHGDLSNGPGKK